MLLLAIDVSLRITAAAAAVGLVLLALRVRSGSVRHAAWCAVLVAMMTMPVLVAVVPGIEVPVPSTPAFDFGTPAPAREPLREAEPAGLPTIAATPPPASSVIDVATDGWRPSTATMLWAVYGVVAGALLIRLGIGWLLARRMVRSATETHGHTRKDRWPVLASPLVSAPITTGILRPVIVLPADWTEWSAFKLRAVLAHENAHISRRDPLVALLAAINRAIFWVHPLAWWLERTLAINAEHACDERAARQAPDAAAYARVLLDFAENVRARRGRVAWQGLGVDGTGLLGTRIDRLLRGDVLDRMSLTRRIATTAACAAALVIAIACRQQVVAAPLKPDPQVEKQDAEMAERTRQFQAAINLSLDQVDALEARIAKDPHDRDARQQLVTYYSAGTKVPWERKVPGLRRHALWIIQHDPDGSITPPRISPRFDPQGFADAKRLWEVQLAKPDVTPFRIYRAANFFREDVATAARLIERGLALDPDSSRLKAALPSNVGGFEWPRQLADLYAWTLLGVNRNNATDPLPQGPQIDAVRARLDASNDPQLLALVGAQLVRQRPGFPKGAHELGRRYLDRALQLKPDLRLARDAIARAEASNRHDRIFEAVRNGTPVPDADRMVYLVAQMRGEFSRAAILNGNADRGAFTREHLPADPAERRRQADNLIKSARDKAEEALKMAAANPQSPDASYVVFSVHQSLGLEALRAGDRAQAVRQLHESVKLPPLSPETPSDYSWLHLTSYLLKEGERDSVAEFFEAFAKINERERTRLLEDAKAVREGRMTRSYQAMFARPQ